jgi:hypothetical protein
LWMDGNKYKMISCDVFNKKIMILCFLILDFPFRSSLWGESFNIETSNPVPFHHCSFKITIHRYRNGLLKRSGPISFNMVRKRKRPLRFWILRIRSYFECWVWFGFFFIFL